jgi:hypothetical protein
MGTLNCKSIHEILIRNRINNMLCYVPLDKISLQLTFILGEEDKLYKTFEKAMNLGVTNFEVCMFYNLFFSNSPNANYIFPSNMTYDLYYHFLAKYIVSKLELNN